MRITKIYFITRVRIRICKIYCERSSGRRPMKRCHKTNSLPLGRADLVLQFSSCIPSRSLARSWPWRNPGGRRRSSTPARTGGSCARRSRAAPACSSPSPRSSSSPPCTRSCGSTYPARTRPARPVSRSPFLHFGYIW